MTTFIVVPHNAAAVQSRLATESDVHFVHPHHQLNGYRAEHVVLTFWPHSSKEWAWVAEHLVSRMDPTAEVTYPTGAVHSLDDLFDLAERRRSQ